MESDVADMTNLSELTEESILENLRLRFANQTIYTYTGSILVALNPYKSLDIYSKARIKQYSGSRMSDNPPHIFAIAEAAVSNVMNFSQNQAIIISGESGAGKTESTKVILQYLTTVTATRGEEHSWIEQQILEANTVLESFGNAKTVRNNNSSRFGKFVQVLFNKSFQIIGASIVNYLLEKSRVVRQAKNERNYHIFYEMVLGASNEERSKYMLLKSISDYRYLSQSGCLDIPGINDKKNYESLKLALNVLKLGQSELESMMKILSAILLLGNVGFVVPDGQDGAQIAENNVDTVNSISNLLNCDYSKLTLSLCFRQITVRGDTTMVPLKETQAYDNRDSISKTIYDKLFNFIIQFINNSTQSKEVPAQFIGVLDIFGFELFEQNSFEQLCINYTNEKLQQFFNQFIFKLEQEEYAREKISVESIVFKDNQPCLDLIESKGGILSLLDEECKVPKGNDDTLLSKLHGKHDKNEYYVKPRTSNGLFSIRHYAGEVPYNVAGFLEKNRDSIADDIFELFSASDDYLLRTVFKKDDSKNADALKKSITSGSNFKAQLTALVSTLSSTTPHYVRCIKPNWEKKPFVFDSELVIAQLRYSGMLETIRIRKSGYPMRFPYETFETFFRYLALSNSAVTSKKDIAIAALKNAGVSKALYQTGLTKMFFKQEGFEKLMQENDIRRALLVVVVQKVVRCHLYRNRYLKIRQSAVCLQRHIKAFVYRSKFIRMQKAALLIQRVIRGWFARDYFRTLKDEKRKLETAGRQVELQQILEAKELEMRDAAIAAGLPPPEPSNRGPNAAEVEAEMQELAKIAEEERNLASYAARLPKKQKDAPLDDLFSFLGDFGENPGAVTSFLQDEFDDIFKLDELNLNADTASVLKISAQKLPETPTVNVVQRPPSILGKAPPPPPPISATPVLRVSKLPPDDTSVSAYPAVGDSGVAGPPRNSPLPKGKPPPPPLPPASLPIIKDSDESKTIASVPNQLLDKVPPPPPASSEIKESSTKTQPQKKDPPPPPPTMQGLFSPQVPAVTVRASQDDNQTGVSEESGKEKKSGMKSNPLARKNSAFPDTVKEDLSMLAFAQKYFNNSSEKKASGLLTIRKSTKTLLDVDDLVYYTKTSISNSMIHFTTDVPKKVELAVDSFRNLLKLLDAGPKKMDEMMSSLQKLVETGIKNADLRDELYVQIVRQISQPPILPKGWDEIESKGWFILSLYCGVFPPSKFFSKYLLNLVSNAKQNQSTEIRKRADYCEKCLKKIMLTGARSMLPSLVEIQAIKQQTPILCRFYLMDGIVKTCNIFSVTTASDVVLDVAERIELKDSAGWSIYEVSDGRDEKVIRGNQYILDILANWELNQVDSIQTTGFETIKKRVRRATISRSDVPAIGAGERKLFMKKRIFKRSVAVDHVEFNLTYAQCVHEVLNDMYPLNEKVALQFAALKAQAEWGDNSDDHSERYNNLALFVPRSLIANQPVDAWKKGIMEFKRKLAGKSTTQAKILYLEALKQFPYFGSARFDVRYKGYWQHPENVVLAISCVGAHLLLKNKTVVDTVSFQFIRGWEVSGDLISISFSRTDTSKVDISLLDKLEVITLESKSCDDIHLLLKENTPKLAMKKDLDEGLASPAEILNLEKDLLKSRFPLLRKHLVPLSEMTVAKVRAVSDLKMPPHVKELFNPAGDKNSTSSVDVSKLSISQISTISEIWEDIMNQNNGVILQISCDQPAVQQIVSGLSSTIWDFAGVDKSEAAILKSGGVAGAAIIIMGLVRKCFGKPRAADELFFQCVKFICKIAVPDSKPLVQLWMIMAVICGSIRPGTSEITEYVKAFLRRSSVSGGSGKPGIEETKMAKYCLRAFVRQIASEPRILPPSMDEINSAIRFQPLAIKFFLTDGQSRTSLIDPATTVFELLQLIKAKLAIEKSAGFALYQRQGAIDEYLSGKEKVADFLAKWESLPQTIHPIFLLKKRIFHRPMAVSESQLEEDFLLAQALEDMKCDRYPLSDDDVVSFLALRVQSENGDALPSKPVDFNSALTKFLPKRRLTDAMISELKREHANLKGKDRLACNRLTMQKVRSWPLYGSALYEVEQNYTSVMQNRLWILVNNVGFHVSDRNEKEPSFSFIFSQVSSVSPDETSIMIVTADSKFVFQTREAHDIAAVMREYQESKNHLTD